jgi:pimeloyl-ACP methyl ester carboxylesterase
MCRFRDTGVCSCAVSAGESIRASVEPASIATAEGVFTASIAGDPGAPLVILLHGFPHTRHTWRDLLPALAGAGFRAVAPDQRGYSPGVRPSDVSVYTTERLVEDVIDIADALGSEALHLVGHDWGGQVAWLTAALHPNRVRSLTSLSRPHPAAFARSFTVDSDQAARSAHHARFLSVEVTDELAADGFSRLRAGLAMNGVPEADVDAYLTVLGDREALDAALNWYRAAGTDGLRTVACADVTVPTLYLWGDRDNSVGRTAAELTVEHVSGDYRFVEIPGHGHFLMDDGAAPTVVAALLDHLRSRHTSRP